ncbi:hypothetical protein HU200_055122 [Digitaria exilis]|uniref:Uncharacterized protein n=1 Tax=Digitaria exilis TaxID=1010633 RepID=A0A835ANE7_9POAL|nr:hypothetical protein HU200_055122 [Digitaria exilis]
MKPKYCLCLLFFLASILVASSAVVTVSPKEKTASAPVQPDEAFLTSLCEQPSSRVLPWCKQLHARRRGGGHLPMPPPSRDGEEIDPRYGVSKRLVPSGPNRLHN